MSGLCIIGLQWGDEAKGKMVDLLSVKHDIVVRYQGGANAGHTVVVGDDVYKLHHVPSGIIHSQVQNIIAPGVVINPPTLMDELDSLLGRGINPETNLLISQRAHVVCPWHLEEDRLMEARKDDSENIGTTLRGIGPCYRDKVGRSFALRLADLVASGLESKVQRIVEYKEKVLSALAGNPVTFDAAAIAKEYGEYGDRLKVYLSDTNQFLFDAVESNKSILFEGAQGALLDIDHGTFPYVTSSNSSGVGICAGSGVAPRWIGKTLGVAKAYSTRVGGGPFPTELHCETGNTIREVGKEFGTTTGRPRRCGWLDAVAVRYTTRLSGVETVALMMLDVLSALDEIKICVQYELDGKTVDSMPCDADVLSRVSPVYETLPGWKEDITAIERFEDLPANAVAYVQRVSELIGRPIEFVSLGPDRRQTLNCFDSTALV